MVRHAVPVGSYKTTHGDRYKTPVGSRRRPEHHTPPLNRNRFGGPCQAQGSENSHLFSIRFSGGGMMGELLECRSARTTTPGVLLDSNAKADETSRVYVYMTLVSTFHFQIMLKFTLYVVHFCRSTPGWYFVSGLLTASSHHCRSN